MGDHLLRRSFEVRGVVQGVGFRPSIFRLANDRGIGGHIQNRSGSISLVLEGEAVSLDEFIEALGSEGPPGSRIESIIRVSEECLPQGYKVSPFQILESACSNDYRVSFPFDLAVCPDCISEVADPANRRFRYAFTTCTACGPRYTVVHGMPYDRARTSLSRFPLCTECEAEYNDPAGRRFHAESIACPGCGPSLALYSGANKELREQDPLFAARREISLGSIVAVRGIGGFLLAVDACNRAALEVLRVRKDRPHKPLAVMARSLDVIESLCRVDQCAREALLSPRAPIVILPLREPASDEIPVRLLSPDTATLGVMLPTSPLHWLLFQQLDADPTPPFDLLVMTSGNRRSEPICIGNDEAFRRLNGVADFFLCHDREINLRADDSVCGHNLGRIQVWRRARGYAPESLRVSQSLPQRVLAMGAHLKSSIALGEGHEIWLSPHIGDLETPEAVAGLERVANELPRFLSKEPEVIAVDLHPDLRSSLLGAKLARESGLRLARIQHHAAHAASCLAEHGRSEGLVLVFDGVGLGTDGSLWGAEAIHMRGHNWERLATFVPAVLPGGDVAVIEPARQLFARCFQMGGRMPNALMEAYGISSREADVWSWQIREGVNAPRTHSAGRLFDAFSAALGFSPRRVSYEGQAAVRLEEAARKATVDSAPELPFALRHSEGRLEVDWTPAFEHLLENGLFGSLRIDYALGFHRALARAAAAMVRHALACKDTDAIGLSGGVFMNRLLSDLVAREFAESGLLRGRQLLIHRLVPPNDGGVAIGQAVLSPGRTEVSA